MSGREDELAARLAALDTRVAAACAASGRRRDEVTVIVVTKTWPVEDLRRLAALGVRDVGENRDQEASVKAAQCSELALRWHFVGAVQSNKAASVARYIDVVHSVDRLSLVQALDRGAQGAGRRVDVLLQVSLDTGASGGTLQTSPPAGRGGVAPDGVPALCDAVSATQGLRLAGVMGVAPRPQAGAASEAGRAFAVLAQVAADVRRNHPTAAWVSAGMSGDLEEAIAAGATHLRVGTAVLGSRPVLG